MVAPDSRSPLRQTGAGRARPPVVVVAAAVAVVLALGAGACSGEEAVPIDPADPPTTLPDLTDVTHSLEPTDQMREAAEQQCLDDGALEEGYIRAVDPDTGAVMAEVAVDCAEVRADAG